MHTLTLKPENLINYSSLAYFFDSEELEILAKVLEVQTYQKEQTNCPSPDCPVLIVDNQEVFNHQQAKTAFKLELPTGEKNLKFTTETDGIYFILKKHKMQDLLKKHPFLALKLNQIADTRLTSLFGKS